MAAEERCSIRVRLRPSAIFNGPRMNAKGRRSALEYPRQSAKIRGRGWLQGTADERERSQKRTGRSASIRENPRWLEQAPRMNADGRRSALEYPRQSAKIRGRDALEDTYVQVLLRILLEIRRQRIHPLHQ